MSGMKRMYEDVTELRDKISEASDDIQIIMFQEEDSPVRRKKLHPKRTRLGKLTKQLRQLEDSLEERI